jgi:hypothetical protein
MFDISLGKYQLTWLIVGKQGPRWEAPQHNFVSNNMAFQDFQPPF